MSEVDLGRYRAIQILGIVELVTFVGFTAALASSTSGDYLDGVPMVSNVSGFLNAYLAGGLTLVPSAVIFIISPFQRKASQLKLARGMQLTLFVCVCIATLPAMLFARWEPLLFGACLAGILFFLIMSSLVKPLLTDDRPKAAVDATKSEKPTLNLVDLKFCPTCGSALTSTDGKCPNCA